MALEHKNVGDQELSRVMTIKTWDMVTCEITLLIIFHPYYIIV